MQRNEVETPLNETEGSAQVNDRFVACIDVVNKIKRLSSLKDKMGKVPHSYTVEADKKWKRYEKQMDPPIFTQRSRAVTQEAYSEKEDQSLIGIHDSAVLKIDKKKLSKEAKKDRAFILRSSAQINSSRSNLISQQLVRTSMINVRDPMQCTAERSMYNLRKPKVLEPMFLSQPENELPVNLRDMVENLKNGRNIRIPGSRDVSSIHEIAGSQTERCRSRDSQVDAIEPRNETFEQTVRGKPKFRGSQTQALNRREKTIRKSFLIKVDQASQIDKSSLLPLSNAQLRDRTYVKMGNLITDENYNLFEPFLKDFEKLSSIFPNFRVKGLQDYTEHPLEDFDTDLDPTLDISYMLEKNNKAKSRWAQKEGLISWRDCIVKSYDRITRQFNIEWEDSEHQTNKTVTRMNLLFPGDNPKDIERRRVQSNVIRCMYLLEDSLRQNLLTRDMLEKCKLYFSYRNFKSIMENSKVDIQTFNQSEFLCNFLLEVLDEYAVSILRFYVSYKTSENFESFVNICNSKIREPDNFVRPHPFFFEESICVLEDSKTTQEASPEVLDRWMVTIEKGEEEEETRDSKSNRNKHVERILIRTIVKNRTTNFVINEAFFKNLLSCSETHQTESPFMTYPRSVSITLGSVDGQNSSSSIHRSHQAHSVPLEKQESSEVYLSKVLIRRTDHVNWKTLKQDKRQLTSNIACLANRLQANLIQPMDIYLGNMAIIRSEIEMIEKVDLFSHLSKALQTPSGRGITDVDWSLVKENFAHIEAKVDSVQAIFTALKNDYIAIVDPRRKQEMKKKMLIICNSVNSELECALNSMLSNSSKKLKDLIRYLLLAFKVESHEQAKFDRLLPKDMYTMKCEGQDKYGKLPPETNCSHHPRALFDKVFSPFKRRMHLIRYYARHYMEGIKKGDLGIIQKCLQGSSTQLITLSRPKLSIAKTGFLKDLKKKFGDSKAKFKESCRSRIKDFNRYSQKYLSTFIESLYHPATCPLTFDISKLGEMEFNNVSQGLLVEFNLILQPFQITPSFASIEKELKKTIVSTLEKLGNISSIYFDEHQIKERYNFCFEEAEEDLADSLRLLDECLAEFAMPWIGFLYVMQSFWHLFIDKGNLLAEELKLLIDKNILDNLETEAFELVKDKKLLDQVPDHVHVGLFTIDVTDVKNYVKSSVNETIKTMFDPHIYNKFTNLLKTNRERFLQLRERLVTPAPEIEQYIEMKRFLESEEITNSLDQISKEIKLCRKLNQFEEHLMKSDSKLINSEYLESLSWVSELTYHKEAAMKRTQEDLPRFKEELSRMSKKLQQDFSFTRISIKDFEEFIDDKEAEIYYEKAVAIDSALDSYLERMAGINRKFEILGEKKNQAFEKDIFREKASFERFLHLWRFIATSWNVDHAQWKKEAFSKLDKDEMEHVITNGDTLLRKLIDAFKENDLILKLVRNKSDEVRKFKVVLDVVKILKNPNFKDRHWDELFNEIRLSDKNDSLGLREGRPDISKLTLEQLMIANVTSHLKLLNNIISRATTEAETEKKIKDINYRIESISIKPTVFDSDSTVLSIIVSIQSIISKLNESLAQCLNMLADPNNPEEFTRELNSLVKLLTFISTVLSMVQTLQSRLIQISPIFKFRDLERFLTKKETISQFVHIREEFKKIIYSIEEKQMKYFIEMIRSEDENEKVNEIQSKLRDLNLSAASVASNLKTFFKMIRVQSPRYFYITDDQMMMLCSLIKFPKSLMGFVTYLFKGISAISVGNHVIIPEMESIEINSVTNRAGEIMNFREPIKVELAAHAEMPLISIVKSLEAGIKETLDQEKRTNLEILANYNFDFGMIFNHWQEKFVSYQMLCLTSQILFDFEITMILLVAEHSKNNLSSGAPSLNSTLTSFKQKILNSIRHFVLSPIRVLKTRMHEAQAVCNLNHFVQLVMGFVSVIDYLIINNVTSSQCYEFQIIPKYSVIFSKTVKVHKDNEEKIAFDELQAKIELEVNPPEDRQRSGGHACYSKMLQGYFGHQRNSVVLTMMEQSIEYKYEVTNPNRDVSVWPLFERISFSLFMAITHCPFIILKGFANQGKLETIRAISNKVAANYYECDMAFNYDIPTISLFIYGMISGGYWIGFKNTEEAPVETLSILASFAEEVSQSVTAKKATISFHGEELLIKGGHALFCSYNLKDSACVTRFEGLGSNICDQFRVINISTPDYGQILSSMVSLVFDDQTRKQQWTFKLLMLCKLLANTETVECKNQANSSLETSQDGPYVDRYIVEESSKSIQAPSLRRSADITLRELVKLVTTALLKYFRSLDAYYASFKDKYGAEYKNLVEKIQLTSDQEQKFSSILKKEIFNWLLIFESHPEKLRTYSNILASVFRNDSGKHVIQYKEFNIAPSKEVQKSIALFKTVFPYPKASLPESDERVEKFATPLLEAILSTDKPRQFIVLGEPNTQKSTLIKLVSFIESELKTSRIPQYWLNLECLSREDVFGDQTYHGILREILLQTNNINLEDKNTNNTTKLNYLFESNNELFRLVSDPRPASDIKVKKPVSMQSSWIVIDANSSKQNEYFYEKVNYLMTIFGNLYEQKEVNQFIGFSSQLKVIYEMSSIATLEPRHVSGASLIFIGEGLMKLHDRVDQWSSQLNKSHPYFFKMIVPKTQTIIKDFIIPLIKHYCSNKSKNDRVFSLSAMSLLNNFLKFFEIFLNEFRKFYIAQDLVEARSNIDNFVTKRKLGAGTPTNPALTKLAGEQFNYGPGMRMAQQAGGLNMITSVRKAKVVDNKVEEDHISRINTADDLEQFEHRKIEGIALICFVGAVYPVLFCKMPTNLVVTVDKFATAYCSKNLIVKQKFADGIFKLIADKRLGGVSFDLARYHYEFTKGKWTPWKDIKFPNKVEVSSSFWDDSFSRYELTRLDCQNSPAYYAAKNQASDDLFCFINPVEKTIIKTSNGNHMRYMLDLFMNYKQHTLLMSDHQQGKSSFLGQMYLRDLVEQRELITFNFVLQHKVTPRAIQAQIEDNLLTGGGNTVVPPQNKRVIIWIDDLQMNTNQEKPESLVRNLQVQSGWFSSNRKNFITIKDCQFLMTYSLTEYNAECSRQSIEALNTDVLSKCLLLKTHLLSYEDLNNIFFEQVNSFIDPHPSSKKEKLASRLFHQLSKVVFYNQDKLRSLSVSLGLNLNLEAFCQLAKTMNLVEWETVAENPENVLFVWHHTMMNFFSSDLDFQGLEFQTIVEEKQSKMAKMIHAPRKSSMFESGTRQRLSVKVNTHLVDMIRGRLSGVQIAEPGIPEDNSDSSDESAKGGQKRLSKSLVNPLADAKKLQVPNMELIVEESDAEDNSSENSQEKSASQRENPEGEEKAEESNGLMKVADVRSKEGSELNHSSNRSNAQKEGKMVTEESESKEISKMLRGNKESHTELQTKKKDDRKSEDSSSESDLMPPDAQLGHGGRSVTDPLGLSDTVSQIRRDLKKIDPKDKRSPIPSLDYLEIDQSKPRTKSGSLKEINLPDASSNHSIKSKKSKQERSEDAEQNSRSHVTSSESSSSKSESDESKSSKSSKASNSDNDDLSEEWLNDDETLRGEFTIDPSKSGTEYFKDFIFSTMNFKLPGNLKQQDILKKVCFDKKHIFDEVLIRELKDLRDNKEDNEDHTFVVADAKDEREIMDFMKTTLSGYIKLNPEALFALKLDGGNFPLLIKHFNMLAMSIITEFQQIYLSSIKSLLYCKTLIGYVGNSIGCPVDYVDLLNCKATRQVEDKLVRIDAYEHIQDLLLQAFPDIWRLKKRIIVVNIPNSAVLEEHQPLLDKVLDLISSIVLNSDMLNQHLGDKLKEMIEMPKREKLYLHYTEYDIKFTIRTRMQARITFILLNDSTENYTEQIKTENSGVRSLDFYSYLNDRYQKLAGKLSKVVINGIKCLEPEDAPSFYTAPLPFEEIEMSPTIAKCLNTELNYLRCVDKDREHFSLVRPYNENTILINILRFVLKAKFDFLEGDSEVADCQREKTQICQRVDRRREISMLEIKEIDNQIEAKGKEKEQVHTQQDELVKKQKEWEDKKEKLHDTVQKLESNLTELSREGKMYVELKLGLSETIKAVRDYKEKEIQTGILTSGFTKNKIFTIYAILFVELSGLSQNIQKRVPTTNLKDLFQTSLLREDYREYITIFEDSLKNFQVSFVETLASLSGGSVPESKVKELSSALESISNTPIGVTSLTSMQRVIMKLIDTAIETIKLEQMKVKRETEALKINETISLLKAQTEKADEFLVMIKEGIADLPALIAKIDERISILRSKREVAESSVQKLSEVMLKFNDFQKAFGKVSQPLLNPEINRESLIDIMACYIVIFNKYPFQIKKKMLYVALQNSAISPYLFEEIPLYEIFSTDTLMTDIMRSKIPCNSNFLTNLSIIDMLNEEQSVLYPLVIDKGKMFMKWCQAKYNKNMCTDRYVPTQNSLAQLENALKTGSMYVAIDPREDLMNLISPIIEWQFRRLTENILMAYNPNMEPSDTINFFGKQIHVGKTFFLCIVLEILPIEEVDQHAISKLLILDNSILNEGLFCETIADELAMNLENNTRGFYVSEYMNKSIQLTIVEKYKKLLQRGHQFDFLKDSLDNAVFKQLIDDIDAFDLLLENLERENQERRAALKVYQNSQKELYSLKLLDTSDEEEFRFLNYPFAYKVTGFLKMMSKYLACANRLWIYFLGLEKMKKFVGSGFTISYDILAHLLKFTISISDIKVTSADIEQNTATFVELFSQVELRAYQALCSMVPASMQFVFSFILGVLLLKKRSEHKVKFNQHLSLFLLSEKILARPSMPTIISTDLKKVFNDKIESIAEYFRDKDSFLPKCLYADPASVTLVHQELRSGVSKVQEKEHEFAMMSETATKTLTSDTVVKAPLRDDTTTTGSLNQATISMNMSDSDKVIFDQDARTQISLASFKNSSFFKAVEEIASDEQIKDFLNDLYLTYQEMKPREIAGFKLTFEQIAKLVQLVVEPDPGQTAPVNLAFDDKGEMIASSLNILKTGGGGFAAMINFSNNFSEAGKGLDQTPGSKRSPSKTPQSSAGINQLSLASKVNKFREKKSFKAFSELIMQKEKVKKGSVKDFVTEMAQYLLDIDKLLFKVDPIADEKDTHWTQFLHSSRNKIFADHTYLNMLPGGEDYTKKTDLLSISSIIKYGRPDWIESTMSRFYGELRGYSYMHKTQNIERIYTYSTNKRCTVLLFQAVNYNPVGMIELMSKKVGIGLLYFNVLRGSLADLKIILENNHKKQTWIIIDNLNLLSSSKASLIVRETTTLLEKFSSVQTFRVWITFQLPLSMLDVSKNRSPGNGEIPLWFGTCYYIFLDKCKNISEEMRNLHRSELSQYTSKVSQEITKNLHKRDKDFIELAQQQQVKNSTSSQGLLKSSTKNLADVKTPSHDGSNTNLDKSMGEGQSHFDIGGRIGLDFIEQLVEAPPVIIVEKRVKSNLLHEMQNYHSSNLQVEAFIKNKERNLFLLKLIISILRHRKEKVNLIFGSSINDNFNLIKDKQLHAILCELLDTCCLSGRGNPYKALLHGFICLFSDWLNLNDPVSSPLVLCNFFKSFIMDLPKTDTLFDFCGVKYMIPGTKTFTHGFGRTFIDSVLTYPIEDSNRLLGLRPNEEFLMEYNQSKACFQFLNSRMSILELAADHSNYLEDFNLVKFAEDNKKKDQEVISRFFLNNIEYGYNLIQNHEFKTEMLSDLKKMINNLISMFSERSYKGMLPYINDKNSGDLSSRNMDDSDSSSDDKGENNVDKQLSLTSKPSNKLEQRVSLLESHGDRFSQANQSPLRDALKKLSKESISRFGQENTGNLVESPDHRALANEFFLQTGVNPKSAKGYMTFNIAEKSVRDSYRGTLLLQEYRTLEKLLTFLTFDLNLARFYLEGDVLSQHKQQGKIIVDCISNNQIPGSWIPRVAPLNLNISSFKEMVKSILVKFDSLYSMAVEITSELPPILNLSNFISPKGLLSNILVCNASHHKVSLSSSVIMLMQNRGDTEKIYQKSTVWTVSGLKIRGGSIDSEGKLINEEDRAKPYDLGSLHLEITQFNEEGQEETNRTASLVNSGEISLMLNVNFQDEKDKTEEFLSEVYEIKKAASFDTMFKGKSPIASGDVTPAHSGRDSRRNSFKATTGAGGPFLNIPGISSFGIGNPTGSSTTKSRRASLAPVVEKPKTYVVRLPVLMTATSSFNTLTDLPLFFYCYSMLPQSHWLERCSYVTLADFDNN